MRFSFVLTKASGMETTGSGRHWTTELSRGRKRGRTAGQWNGRRECGKAGRENTKWKKGGEMEGMIEKRNKGLEKRCAKIGKRGTKWDERIAGDIMRLVRRGIGRRGIWCGE
jgi:hypothetical protein